jgi:AcrR family transcriptional regulator
MPKVVDHEERREELAAWRVIAERGIDEATIREIARESGYSSGVLAHYFKNKDDLLAHALLLSHGRIRRRYVDDMQASTAIEALKAVILDNLPMDKQRNLEMRIEMSFWARALRNDELHEIQEKESEVFRKLFRKLVEEAQEEAEISPELDRETVLEVLGSLIDGASLRGLLYPKRMPPKKQAALVDYALGLLK